MGYFSNGCEGADWEEAWCRNCVHGQDIDVECPVMELHALWNYDQCDGSNEEPGSLVQQVGQTKAEALDALVARDFKTLSIVKSNVCRMFHPLTSDTEKELREARRQAARDRDYVHQQKDLLTRGRSFRLL